MSSDKKPRRSTAFAHHEQLFGAYHQTRGLVLAVEAKSRIAAKERIAHVAGLVRVHANEELLIQPLESVPEEVPMFFSSYFEQLGGQDVLSRVGPSSRSLQ